MSQGSGALRQPRPALRQSFRLAAGGWVKRRGSRRRASICCAIPAGTLLREKGRDVSNCSRTVALNWNGPWQTGLPGNCMQRVQGTGSGLKFISPWGNPSSPEEKDTDRNKQGPLGVATSAASFVACWSPTFPPSKSTLFKHTIKKRIPRQIDCLHLPPPPFLQSTSSEFSQ